MNSEDIESGPSTKQVFRRRDGRMPAQLSTSTKMSIGVALVVFVLAFLHYARQVAATDGQVVLFIASVCSVMLVFTLILTRRLLARPDGTAEMRVVSDAIREGAEAFMQTQYTTIAKFSVLVSVSLLFFYMMRPSSIVASLPVSIFAAAVAMSFLVGATCSALAGFVGMWVAVRANIRVASACTHSYHDAIVVAMRGGACSGLFVVGMCVMGLVSLYVFFRVFGEQYGLTSVQIPHVMIGYAFGASFVALFAQVGGGIYTKAADVGADIVGKVEAGIPEDDPRNPAVIADLVGDNVGDCAGRGADLFESICGEMIGTMIIGAQLSSTVKFEASGFIFFPLALHALDLVISSIGVLCLSTSSGYVRPGVPVPSAQLEDPLAVLKRGYFVSVALSILGITALCRTLLYIPRRPDAWWQFASCGYVGIASAVAHLFIAQYYTDYAYGPVREIAEASRTGHATNVIAGISVGMRSTGFPCIVIGLGILISHRFGEAALPGGGLYGTAVATMGMLSTAVYVLAMDTFGPIGDNAGGIVEMSQQEDYVRDMADRLDAVGNVTKAATKGYAIGSAGLASFLLFRAFMDVIEENSGIEFDVVDFSRPEIFVGGLMGAVLIFVFSGMVIKSVGIAAQSVVKEVRAQFSAMPGIMTYKQKPNYHECVRIVTKAALAEMLYPVLLVVGSPTLIGFVFRTIGAHTDRPLLGPQVLCGFLMSTTLCGICMALFLNNAGGAWDNAKKYVETGQFGGKGSESHKSAVTGDTVGDPFKDSAGPSIHVVVKLVATISLVLGPLFL